MKNPEDLRIIAGWLNNLAELTRHGEEGKPTKAKTAIMATMLGEDFPATAFTLSSLHAVTQGQEWFPAYDVLRQRVGEWWRENRPAVARALPAPDGYPLASRLEGMDAVWFGYFIQRQSESFGPPHSTARPSTRALCLSLVRQMSPAAAAVIMARAGDEGWREAA